MSQAGPVLGQIQDFTEGGSIVGPPKAVPCRGGPGASSENSFLVNAISDVLRPSHGVLRSRFFNSPNPPRSAPAISRAALREPG